MRRLVLLDVDLTAPQPGLAEALAPDQRRRLLQCLWIDMEQYLRRIPDVEHGVIVGTGLRFPTTLPSIALPHQDLLARLEAAFDHAFGAGYAHVVILTTNCITLPRAHIERLLQVLDDPFMHVALGPNEDGSLFALGMRQLHPAIFESSEESAHLVRETLTRAGKARLFVGMAPEWYPVATPADLYRLGDDLTDPTAQTYHMLRELGYV